MQRPCGGYETGRVYLRKGIGGQRHVNIVGRRNCYERSLETQAAGLATQSMAHGRTVSLHGLIYFYKD